MSETRYLPGSILLCHSHESHYFCFVYTARTQKAMGGKYGLASHRRLCITRPVSCTPNILITQRYDYINYVYGALLGLKFYEMYMRDLEHFIPRYIALMRNGFDAPPEVLLKRFLDIDLHDPRLVSNALSLIAEKIDLLEKSYQK